MFLFHLLLCDPFQFTKACVHIFPDTFKSRGNQPLFGRETRSSQHNVICPRPCAGGLDPRPGTLFTLPESDCRTGPYPTKEEARNSPESHPRSRCPGSASSVTPSQELGQELDQRQNSLSAQDANHAFNRESLHPTETFGKNSVSLVHYNCTDLRVISYLWRRLGLPMGGAVVKNLPANAGVAGDAGLIPGSGRYLGVGNGNPLPYFGLGNPMDRGGWWAPWGLKESELSNWACTHTHMHDTKYWLSRTFLFTWEKKVSSFLKNDIVFSLDLNMIKKNMRVVCV